MNRIKFKRRIGQVRCAAKYYIVYVISKLYRVHDNAWLIAERGTDARDNGYVFYRYLKKVHPEISVKFVISDTSPDRDRLETGDIVRYGSFEHYLRYITAPMLLSTHYQGYSPNLELFSQLDKRGLISVKGKKVLLDHCVRMGKAGCTANTVKIDLMICSIPREYEALSKNSGYKPSVLCDIGMPRFDNLIDESEKLPIKQILFMPTWRVKYTNASEMDFVRDEYFIGCKELLESDELASFLEEKNMNFVFYPHIEMQKYIHLFSAKSKRIVIRDAGSAIVENLLLESSILITDYSSVFFDFAYMLKPVIYYQFDNDENERAASKRWFDFEKDGFGPICRKSTEVIKILHELENTRLGEKYQKRVKEMFPIRDKNNSERVYQAIIGLEKDERK